VREVAMAADLDEPERRLVPRRWIDCWPATLVHTLSAVAYVVSRFSSDRLLFVITGLLDPVVLQSSAAGGNYSAAAKAATTAFNALWKAHTPPKSHAPPPPGASGWAALAKILSPDLAVEPLQRARCAGDAAHIAELSCVCVCARVCVCLCVCLCACPVFVLQGCMDPRMMQQLGGSENLMNMMKEMNKQDLNGMFPGLK